MRKMRADGSQAFAWTGVVTGVDAECVSIAARFNVPVWDMGFATIREGDVFQETYYWGRWFNVFRVAEPGGTLKGWYCNVGSPPEVGVGREGEVELRYVDLELDVWVTPEGARHVLDEEEFATLTAEGGCSAVLREGALRGRDELMAFVEQLGQAEGTAARVADA